jgi:hypothetical protein
LLFRPLLPSSYTVRLCPCIYGSIEFEKKPLELQEWANDASNSHLFTIQYTNRKGSLIAKNMQFVIFERKVYDHHIWRNRDVFSCLVLERSYHEYPHQVYIHAERVYLYSLIRNVCACLEWILVRELCRGLFKMFFQGTQLKNDKWYKSEFYTKWKLIQNGIDEYNRYCIWRLWAIEIWNCIKFNKNIIVMIRQHWVTRWARECFPPYDW